MPFQIFKRLVSFLLTMLAAMVLILSVLEILPGDPALVMLRWALRNAWLIGLFSWTVARSLTIAPRMRSLASPLGAAIAQANFYQRSFDTKRKWKPPSRLHPTIALRSAMRPAAKASSASA